MIGSFRKSFVAHWLEIFDESLSGLPLLTIGKWGICTLSQLLLMLLHMFEWGCIDAKNVGSSFHGKFLSKTGKEGFIAFLMFILHMLAFMDVLTFFSGFMDVLVFFECMVFIR